MRASILSLLLIFSASFAQDDIRFTSIDIYIDSPAPVAAWQFELNDTNGTMKVVGVENGASNAFDGTPYYDREAVQLGTADRIVVADYSLNANNELPSGRFRITTLHLMLTGTYEPEFNLSLITANTRDGEVINASIHLESSRGTEQ